MNHNKDLSDWNVCDPDHAQDILPMPYRLIDQVLKQTILYQMQLALHHIQQKKKDQNYQGKVKQYIAQSLIELEDICCLSSNPKFQNYLVAGDLTGQILILDMAKKSIYAKKQLMPQKRISYITQHTLYDGQTFITNIAVILNNLNTIYILRYKHNQAKLYLALQVEVATDDFNQYPFTCQFQDHSRMLIVTMISAAIVGYAIPDLRLDQERLKVQHAVNQAALNASNTIRKQNINPLQFATIERNQGKITEKKFHIKFQGYQKPLKYKDLINKFKNQSKVLEPEVEVADKNKKDSKKDPKKVQTIVQPTMVQVSQQIEFNQKLTKQQANIVKGKDISLPYSCQKYSPYIYCLYSEIQCPRKKEFQKTKNILIATRLIYGWTNTKDFYIIDLHKNPPTYENIPYYLLFQTNQEVLTQANLIQRDTSYGQKIQIGEKVGYKSIYNVTATAISTDRLMLGLGLEDGTVAVWSTSNVTLQFNTDKHKTAVTSLAIFQSWKIISGSGCGSVHIDNFLTRQNQTKRTNIFQSKQPYSISEISLNQQVGIAYVNDSKGNVRVYDLWRGQKISRLLPCNNFAMMDNKGKKWVHSGKRMQASMVYTNRDYTVLLSIDYPTLPISKVVETPKQLLDKVQQLQLNPWKSNNINVHVIRNFQFLLDHFDGLQNVYKKGYEKQKVSNLFTNLQFSQLYDRNFDIPDFGRVVQGSQNKGQYNKSQKSGLTVQSKFSRQASRQKTKISQRQGTSKKIGISTQRNQILTDQVLHPQKFLFQRRRINAKQSFISSVQKLVQVIRQQHKGKQRRQNLLQHDLIKTIGI